MGDQLLYVDESLVATLRLTASQCSSRRSRIGVEKHIGTLFDDVSLRIITKAVLIQCAMVFVTTFTKLKNRITILLCFVFAFSKTNAQTMNLQNAWAKANQFDLATFHSRNQPAISFSSFAVTSATQKISSIAPSFYVQHLPFVCKAEWQMQKTVKLPLVFRLGDINFVNFLEEKPNNTWGK